MAQQLTQYLIYIVPVILIICIGVFLWLRSRKKPVGENQAMMYSVVTKNIVDIKPFVLVYRQDGTKAIFTEDVKQQQKSGGILGFFKDIIKKKQPQDFPGIKELPFSELMAIRNVKANGWFAIFADENGVQLPLISGDSKFLEKILDLERNVEKRVSRLRSAQKAIQSYVQTSTPVPTYGAVQILNIVLLFIALLAIAYCVSSVTTSVTSMAKLISALHTLLPVATNSTHP